MMFTFFSCKFIDWVHKKPLFNEQHSFSAFVHNTSHNGCTTVKKCLKNSYFTTDPTLLLKTWKDDTLHQPRRQNLIINYGCESVHTHRKQCSGAPCTFYTAEWQTGRKGVMWFESSVDWMHAALSNLSNCSLHCTSNLSPNFVLCLQTYCHSVYLFPRFSQRNNNERLLQIVEWWTCELYCSTYRGS